MVILIYPPVVEKSYWHSENSYKICCLSGTVIVPAYNFEGSHSQQREKKKLQKRGLPKCLVKAASRTHQQPIFYKLVSVW